MKEILLGLLISLVGLAGIALACRRPPRTRGGSQPARDRPPPPPPAKKASGS